jgi:hypothetical protein
MTCACRPDHRIVVQLRKLDRDAALVIWNCRAPLGLGVDASLAAT